MKPSFTGSPPQTLFGLGGGVPAAVRARDRARRLDYLVRTGGPVGYAAFLRQASYPSTSTTTRALLAATFDNVPRLPDHQLGQLLGLAHSERTAFEHGPRQGVRPVFEEGG